MLDEWCICIYYAHMPAKNTKATERALKRIAKGQTPYASALAEGIAPSTIYRALKRILEANLKRNKAEEKS